MKLISVYDLVIKEAAEVMEFPNDNFTVSIFRAERKIIFSPQQHQYVTKKVRSHVNAIKQNFHTISVTDLPNATFEIELDPRESIDEVVKFLSMLANNQETLF